MLHSVFAYGSNLDLQELGQWLKARGFSPEVVVQSERAELFGHVLCWRYYSEGRAGGAASVERRPGSSVFGAVLRVTDPGLCALDQKEGAPSVYRRRPVWVQLSCRGWEKAWVYEVTAAHRSAEFVPPTHYYRQRLLDGGRAFGLPAAHLASIEAVPVRVD